MNEVNPITVAGREEDGTGKGSCDSETSLYLQLYTGDAPVKYMTHNKEKRG